MTEFETCFIGINGIIAGAYCISIFKQFLNEKDFRETIQNTEFHLSNLSNIIEIINRDNKTVDKKEFKTKRKKDTSVTIPKKLRIIKDK